MVVNFNAEGRVVGIEFEDASALAISEVEINGLPTLKVVAARQLPSTIEPGVTYRAAVRGLFREEQSLNRVKPNGTVV